MEISQWIANFHCNMAASNFVMTFLNVAFFCCCYTHFFHYEYVSFNCLLSLSFRCQKYSSLTYMPKPPPLTMFSRDCLSYSFVLLNSVNDLCQWPQLLSPYPYRSLSILFSSHPRVFLINSFHYLTFFMSFSSTALSSSTWPQFALFFTWMYLCYIA